MNIYTAYTILVILALLIFTPNIFGVAKENHRFSVWDLMVSFLLIVGAPLTVPIWLFDHLSDWVQETFPAMVKKMQYATVWGQSAGL